MPERPDGDEAGATDGSTDDLTVRPDAATIDPVSNPETGVSLRVLATGADTDGRLARYEVRLAPPSESHGPHLHVHPAQRETFEVVSGRLGVQVGDETCLLDAGDAVDIDAGVPHRFWNAGGGATRFVGEVSPPLRTVTLMSTIFRLAADGWSTEEGLPINPFALAVVVDAFPDHIYLGRLPVPLQKLALWPLARVGRRLGYEPAFPAYVPDSEAHAGPTPGDPES